LDYSLPPRELVEPRQHPGHLLLVGTKLGFGDG
jgi:hypothetical protein